MVLETERLMLRRLVLADAPFMVELLNEPSFLRFIGDKQVRTVEDAHGYLTRGPLDMYARHGLGLYLVTARADGTPLGIAGLIKRDGLDDVDLGFAFSPRYWGQGYAHEAAAALLPHAREAHQLTRLVAITSVDNEASIRLLEKLGFRFERFFTLGADPETLRLFGRAL
jgi:RimJ/RimL family protein N-acetyltransferase